MPWSVTERSPSNLDSLVIHCGDHHFRPELIKAPYSWTGMTSAYTVYGLDQNDNENARLCTRNTLGMMMESDGIAGGDTVKIVLLCDGSLVRSAAPHSTGSQFWVAGIAAQAGKAGLYPGKRMDEIAYTACLSAILLHKLMHVTQMDICQLAYLYIELPISCVSND